MTRRAQGAYRGLGVVSAVSSRSSRSSTSSKEVPISYYEEEY